MPGKRVIIKVGGSVLENEPAYAEAASALAGYIRRRPDLERFYVVVSAKKGATDRAIEALAPGHDIRGRLRRRLEGDLPGAGGFEFWDRPRHSFALLWREIESAFHLAECLSREGQPATVRLGAARDLDRAHRRADPRRPHVRRARLRHRGLLG